MGDESLLVKLIEGVQNTVNRVDGTVGKVNEKVEKLGTVTGELKISQVRIEEQLATTKTRLDTMQNKNKRNAGLWGGFTAGVVYVTSRLAEFTGSGGGGNPQ